MRAVLRDQRQQLLGLLGVDVPLHEALGADHQQRVAERRHRVLDLARLDRHPREQELGAEAEGLLLELLLGALRHLRRRRQGRALEGRDHALEQAQEAEAAGVDHARLLEDRQQLGGALERGVPGLERAPQQRDRRLVRRGSATASAASRTTVRMVPSTGFITAAYAVLVAPLSATASAGASSSAWPLTASAKPFRTCDRMTPELPRAPSSEP
jgi:hypothetical protein